MKIINLFQIVIFLNGFSIYASINCGNHQHLNGLFVIHRFSDLSSENNSPSLCPKLKSSNKIQPNDFRLINRSIERSLNEVGRYLNETHFTHDFGLENLEIYTSDKYRSIQFTELVIDGLIGSKENDNRSMNLDWKLDHSSDVCPAISNEIEYPINDDIYDNYKDLFQYLTNLCGANITTIDQVRALYEIWLSETYAESKKPILDEYDFKLNDLLKLISIKDQMQCENTNSQRTATNLKVGLFLNDILQKMQKISENKVIKSNKINKKAFIYSTNDVFFNCLMSTLGFDYVNYSPYGNNQINGRKFGSTIVIELHRCELNNSSDYESDEINYFKIYYFDHDKLHVNIFPRLTISGCSDDEFCELKHFKNKIKDFILDQDEWTDECKISNSIETINDPTLIFIILIIISTMLNITFIVAIVIFRKRSRFNLV